MLRNTLQFSLALFLAGYCVAPPSSAQVSGDGSLSTTVSSPDSRNFVIDGGDRAGNNLFHSFREFSVPTGGSAAFNNATDVQNIFSRVTGGNLSNIDGLIRANGSANLFLLNPNGILFGANARLNIGGSFIGSTASSLRFSDGIEFSATPPSASPVLTVSVPVGLQFGQNSGDITLQGAGHHLASRVFFPLDRRNNPIGLQVKAGNTLALFGGTVNLSGGILSTTGGGHLEIGSVGNGELRLRATNQGWVGDYSAISRFNDIHLAQQSLLDASGGNGSIQLQGQSIGFTEGSTAVIQNLGTNSSGGITIHATDSLSLTGNTADRRSGSLIQIENLGMGTTGEITLSAERLFLLDGAGISQRTFSQAPSGNITINVADSITIDGFVPANPANSSVITTNTYTPANGGNLTVSTGTLRILNGGNLAAVTFGTGQAGSIRVKAQDLIEIAGNNPITLFPSSLTSATLGAGDANNISVSTSRLLVRDGGLLGSSTPALGSSGSVTINASESVEVRGRATGSITSSRIASTAETIDPVTQAALRLPPIPSGNSGSLIISTPFLRITDGALVTVKNDGPGRAGDLQINASAIALDNQGGITASTLSGNGGNIRLNLQEGLMMQHRSFLSANAAGTGSGGQINLTADRLDLLSNSSISTQSSGSGNAGTLQLQVDQLRLNRGQIAVESLGTGNAGRLLIHADSMQLNNQSVINASTQIGRGGDVQLQVRDTLELNNQSRILADAQQSGRGGNINISASDTLLRDRSRISTNAQGRATGGALTVEGDRLSLFDGSQITSSTVGSGRAGSLNIQANDAITLSGRNTRLAAASTTDAAAGSIRLRSPEVNLSDRAAISVSGQGQGGAGNLRVQANQIELDNRALLEAEVAGGDRGNITLNSNTLLLRNGSTITTNATGTASGGNINVNTNFLIGLENSDIVARAEQGQGGNIGLTAQSVLGILPRTQLTPDSDINASSQLGFDGAISITNPDVKPDSGLVELPEEITDSSQQIAATCSSTQNSQFIITGRGGIPTSPDALQEGDRFWSDLRDLSAFSNDASVASQPISSFLQPGALSEVTQWSVNAKGQVELVAVASLDSSNFTQPTCNASFTEHD